MGRGLIQHLVPGISPICRFENPATTTGAPAISRIDEPNIIMPDGAGGGVGKLRPGRCGPQAGMGKERQNENHPGPTLHFLEKRTKPAGVSEAHWVVGCVEFAT